MYALLLKVPSSHNKISILTCIVYVISIFIGARKYSLSDNRKLKQQPRKRFFQIFLKILVNNGYENHTHLTVSRNVGGYINSCVDRGKYFLFQSIDKSLHSNKTTVLLMVLCFFFFQEGLDKHFNDKGQDSAWWRGVFLTTLGLGTLAAFMYSR